MEQNSQNEKSVETNKIERFFNVRWTKIKSMKGKDWLNFFLNNAIIFVLIIFLIIIAIIAANQKSPINIFSITNIFFIIENSARDMFLALGVGGIIILTGTDLSAGRILGFTSIFSIALLQSSTFSSSYTESMKVFKGITAFPVPVVMLIVMIIGGIFGVINGFFVAKFKLHPFIVTLATGFMILGFAGIVASWGRDPVANPITAYTKFADDIIGYHIELFGQPLHIYVFIAIFAIIFTWFLWNYTTFGKNMYAVGCNPEAATVSGINVNKTIILVFMYAGILYGFSGFLYGSWAGSTSAKIAMPTGQNFELYAIAACVIGGISFTGGIGKISGAVIGVLVLDWLTYGLSKIGITGFTSQIFSGAIILFAVTLDMRKYIVKR